MAIELVYGVFVGTKWGVTRNRDLAISTAQRDGGTVRTMSADCYGTGGWDAPTFYALSSPLAD